MQRYGMYHADGGNIALTAQSDSHTDRSRLVGRADRRLRALARPGAPAVPTNRRTR